MRKLRNTGEPIEIDARLPALVSLLEETADLVAAYLYGSYGTSDQTPLSDVDLALLFMPGREPRGTEELELVGRILSALQEEDVSVTILNRAPSIFQYTVLETGRSLICKDPVALADFIAQVLSRHADYMIDYGAFLEEYDEALVRAYGRG
jgi:predicted nucleotidyltransferase